MHEVVNVNFAGGQKICALGFGEQHDVVDEARHAVKFVEDKFSGCVNLLRVSRFKKFKVPLHDGDGGA